MFWDRWRRNFKSLIFQLYTRKPYWFQIFFTSFHIPLLDINLVKFVMLSGFFCIFFGMWIILGKCQKCKKWRSKYSEMLLKLYCVMQDLTECWAAWGPGKARHQTHWLGPGRRGQACHMPAHGDAVAAQWSKSLLLGPIQHNLSQNECLELNWR